MEEQSVVTYKMIVEKMQQLHTHKSSGALVITGMQVTRIHFTDGTIVALFVHEKKGHEAVPLLASLRASKMHFIPGVPCSLTTPLPATDVLLQQLAMHEPHTVTPTVPSSTRPASRGLDAASQEVIVGTLAKYIGPMAMMLGQDLQTSYPDVEEAIISLAKRLPKTEQANRFMAETREKLALVA